MAARPASPDQIKKLAIKLGRLRLNYGVWRDGLAGYLGQELCDRLHVITKPQPGGPEADGADEVRAKVIWHLRRLIKAVANDEENRRSAAISYNITPYPELRTMNKIGDRAQWGYERGLCRSRERVDDRTMAVIPDVARELSKIQPVPPRADIDAIIAEWRPSDDQDPPASDNPTVGETDASPTSTKDSSHPGEPVVNQSVTGSIVMGGVMQIGYIGGEYRTVDG